MGKFHLVNPFKKKSWTQGISKSISQGKARRAAIAKTVLGKGRYRNNRSSLSSEEARIVEHLRRGGAYKAANRIKRVFKKTAKPIPRVQNKLATKVASMAKDVFGNMTMSTADPGATRAYQDICSAFDLMLQMRSVR